MFVGQFQTCVYCGEHAIYLFSHTWTYTFIYPPTHPHTPTATCSSMTKMQIVHFCRIAQCTMVKNVPCAWQFICKASSNTLCTLFVQTNSSTCNYETPQRRSGQFDNTAGPHFSLGCRNYISLKLKLQETTLDDHRKSVFPLVNPHCSVPWHCCLFAAETEPHQHGLPVLLS